MPDPLETSGMLRYTDLVKPSAIAVTLYDQDQRNKYVGTFTQGSKAGFEGHAFSRLFDARERLGIRGLYRCGSARVDGFLRLVGGDDDCPVLMEVKTTLGWNSLGTALAQFVSGRKLLMRKGEFTDSVQGLIVFSRLSPDWSREDPHPLRPWAQLYQHIDELAGGFKIWPLQLTATGVYNPFLGADDSAPLIQKLVEGHEPGNSFARLQELAKRAFA